MGFRIHRGIFQKLNAERTAYENTFKIDEDGRIKEVDADGNVTSGYLKVGEQATDADTVDGLHSGSFIRSDASDNVSGHTEWQDNYQIRLGAGADLRIWHDGNNHVFRSYHHGANYYFQLEDNEGTNKNGIIIQGDTSRSYVRLYEDGSERFRTKSTGVEVYGNIRVSNGITSTSSGGYGIIRGYDNDNHFIVIRGSVGTGTSTLSITGAHRTTFVEHVNEASEGWYFVSKASGNYTEMARIDGVGQMYIGGNKVWHAGNDGSGSGLDADTVDGYHAIPYNSGSFVVGGDAETYYPVIIRKSSRTTGRITFYRDNVHQDENSRGSGRLVLTGFTSGWGHVPLTLHYETKGAGGTLWKFIGGNYRTNYMVVYLKGATTYYYKEEHGFEVNNHNPNGEPISDGRTTWNPVASSESLPTWEGENPSINTIEGGTLYHDATIKAPYFKGDGRHLTNVSVAATANAVAWANVSGKPSTFAPSSHTHGIGGIVDAPRWWNNFGDNHTTRTSFDAEGGSLSTGFGWRYIQGSANGPGTSTSPNQYYGVTVGLGNDYNYDNYGMQLVIPRNTSTPYISVRFEENRVLGSWQKISAGYADSAGAVAWSNVSGKPTIPTNNNQLENGAGYITDLPNAGIGAGTYGSTSNQTKIDTITVDAKGRVTAVATGTGGDITTVRLLDDAGAYVQDTGGTAALTIAGGAGITTSASGTTITITNSEAGEADAVRTELDTRITTNSTDIARNATDIATKAAAGGSYGQDFAADDMYVDQWFRNTVSGKGLYNQATTQHWYSDGDDYWNIAGGGTFNAIRFRDEHNGTQRGLVGADNNNRIGFLDAGGNWAVRHDNDSGTLFYTDNETLEFRVGRDKVTGNYGTVQTDTTRSSWGGYSIAGRVVFMHDHSNGWGIYNDVNNEWMVYGTLNGYVQLRYNNSTKLQTTSGGVSVTGTVSATAFAGDGSALTGISAGAPPVVTTVEGGEESTLASIHFNPGEGVATFTLGDGSTYRLAFAR